MLVTFSVFGYRSLRDLCLPLDQLNVITGANGAGKSSVYRALRLLADVAQGRIIASLANEGGFRSSLWAGPEKISKRMRSGEIPVQGTIRDNAVSLKLGVSDEDFGYAIDLGMPVPVSGSRFGGDPVIKAEAVWAGEALSHRNQLAMRRGGLVRIRDLNGVRDGDSSRRGSDGVLLDLADFDSMMTHAADPRSAPELLLMRERMRGWRFYDHFRTDAGAPARQVRPATRTPVLAHDGSDLAAALQTIIEVGDEDALAETVADAFPGSSVEIIPVGDGLAVQMRQHGLLRPLGVAELSDGTLRYLLLVAALLTPRPPSLMVLNEPETSLHPDLLAPLARLILRAARDSQLIVVSHADALTGELVRDGTAQLFNLAKDLGETVVRGIDRPDWAWPKR